MSLPPQHGAPLRLVVPGWYADTWSAAELVPAPADPWARREWRYDGAAGPGRYALGARRRTPPAGPSHWDSRNRGGFANNLVQWMDVVVGDGP